jgi:Rieske Fe-S protein
MIGRIVEIDRREFVTVCARGAAALALSGCASLVTHPVPVSDNRIRFALAAFPELATADGAIKLQPAGLEDPVYVLATSSGEFHAVSPICTHRGCTVDVKGPRLVCPCHGSTYDRAGRVLRGPAERALTTFPVAREGDFLVIALAGTGA